MTDLDYLDSVDYVVKLLEERLGGGEINTFYPGDPDLLATHDLPAILVSKTVDTSEAEASIQDEITETLVVKLVLDKSDDWTGKVKPEDVTETKLRRMMEARDPQTGKWLPSTIRGVLRSGLASSQPYVGETTSLEYGVSPRPNDLVGAEAHLTVTVKYSVEVDQVFN